MKSIHLPHIIPFRRESKNLLLYGLSVPILVLTFGFTSDLIHKHKQKARDNQEQSFYQSTSKSVIGSWTGTDENSGKDIIFKYDQKANKFSIKYLFDFNPKNTWKFDHSNGHTFYLKNPLLQVMAIEVVSPDELKFSGEILQRNYVKGSLHKSVVQKVLDGEIKY
jgi:hypothetical protein